MLVSTPRLARAQVGDPVTAQGFNELLAGLRQAYDAAATAGRDYVQIDVRFRGGPVDGARVVVVPTETDGGPPSGPPIECAPDGGDGTGFRFPAVAPGWWTVYVEAPGFASCKSSIEVTPSTVVGPVLTVAVELERTHLFVPDVVGFSLAEASDYLRARGFYRGTSADINRVLIAMIPVPMPYGTVMVQGPAAGTPVQLVDPSVPVPAADMVSVLFQPLDSGDTASISAPWRTMVPSIVGRRERDLHLAASLELRTTIAGSASGELRVIDQRPRAGDVVAVGTFVDATLARGEAATVKLGAFAGTHRRLADTTALSLVNTLRAQNIVGDSDELTPWELFRHTVDDAVLTLLSGVFDKLKAPVTDAPAEGLAEMWQSLCVAAVIGNEKG